MTGADFDLMLRVWEMRKGRRRNSDDPDQSGT